jgi:anaerobic selenocysteine-containing dehydrogenase
VPNGCGLEIGVKDGRIVGVRGLAGDSVNRGRLGPKGLNAWVANASADRLTRPLIRVGTKGEGKFREASWSEAMDEIVKKMPPDSQKIYQRRDRHLQAASCSLRIITRWP